MPNKLDPGVYPGLTRAEYDALPYMNVSTLQWGLTSAEHLRAAYNREIEYRDSDDLRYGRMLHAQLLEPERFAKEFPISHECRSVVTSKQSKRHGQICGSPGRRMDKEGQWWCGTHAPADADEPTDWLTTEEHGRILATAEKLASHSVVRLFRARGGCETAVIADVDGVRCKVLVDKLLIDAGCPDAIIDIKKVQVGQGTPRAFARSVDNYHYDMKAAWNVDLVKHATGKMPHFIWVVIEDRPPFSINVLPQDDEGFELGQAQYSYCLALWKRGMETGLWPGYSDDINWTWRGRSSWREYEIDRLNKLTEQLGKA